MAFRKSRTAQGRASRVWSETELIWGVPRRPGYDDQDDPKGHAGLTQHAFEPGNDERAICGFEPPKRASGPGSKPRPQLAMPTARLNPRCAKCARLVETSSTEVLPPALLAIDAAGPVEASPAVQPVAAVSATGPATRSKSQVAPTESWEGTVKFGTGDVLTAVRPPSQRGLGVVASVVSGPSGTRVASVDVDAAGMAVITLSEPARGPVTVAWFAVPAVDHDALAAEPAASPDATPGNPPDPVV
jgi:hypothetical protein